VLQYIINNPARRGMVENGSLHPYCSAFSQFELDKAPQGLKPAA
jgi:hypothetical protein